VPCSRFASRNRRPLRRSRSYLLQNVISTANDESHPAFTSDSKTLYFLKNDPSFNHWTIVVFHEQNGKWSTPEVALCDLAV